jgi:hypothetical protein
VYVNEGFGSVDRSASVPGTPKSHWKLIESFSSGSREPSLENWTVSGATPLVGVAFMTAFGRCGPAT